MTFDYFNYIVHIRKKYLEYFSKEFPIVDIGCGDGFFIRLLKEQGYSAIGVDANSSCIKKCKERNIRVFREDALSYLEQNQKSFGGIICSHLIEHIPNDHLNSFIRRCYEAMIQNGILLIITPNINNLGGSANFWNDPTHIRPFTLSSMQKLLSKNRFEIIRIGYDKDTKLSVRKKLFHFPLDIIRQFLSIIIYGIGGLYTEIFVIAKKL